MINFTQRLDKAIRVAAWAHEQANQHRKGSGIPYIIHPFGTMLIASSVTNDEDVLIACLLHDVLEDVDETIYSEQKMNDNFGERVVSIVEGVTKDTSIKSWQGRADAYLYHLENEASDESVIVSCADKIHNLMSILADYRILGDKLWSRFNAGKEKQLWWYQEILRVTSKRAPSMNLNKDLAKLVEELRTI